MTFDETVRLCLPLLRQIAIRLTGNQADAEDVVQDALIKALAAWQRFDGRHPKAWLVLIVHRCFLDEYRRRVRQSTEAETEALDHEAAAWSHYLDAQRALVTLSPEFRAVLELAMTGHGHEEIAEQLGIPVNTSRTRLWRARRDVEEALR